MDKFNLNTNTKIETGFKVPDYYFYTLLETVENKTTHKQSTVISLFNATKKKFYSAAAVLVLCMFIPFLYKSSSSAIEPHLVENYLLQNNELLIDEIAEGMDSEALSEIKIDYKIDGYTIEEELYINTNFVNFITN